MSDFKIGKFSEQRCYNFFEIIYKLKRSLTIILITNIIRNIWSHSQSHQLCNYYSTVVCVQHFSRYFFQSRFAVMKFRTSIMNFLNMTYSKFPSSFNMVKINDVTNFKKTIFHMHQLNICKNLAVHPLTLERPTTKVCIWETKSRGIGKSL